MQVLIRHSAGLVDVAGDPNFDQIQVLIMLGA
jgi:hypothetical protein